MLLWLPYFFVKIGYHQGASLSLVYPLGYILSPLIFQPLQLLFRNFIREILLGLLLIDLICALFIYNINGDNEDMIKYVILLFICALLSCGYIVFTETIDQKNRAPIYEIFAKATAINRSILQFIEISQTTISGIVL